VRELTAIPRHDRLQHCLPSVSAVNIARAQRAPFQIAELVEHEQRMIAGAFVMAIPDAVLLLAVRRAHARIHIEHDASWWTAAMNAVDPFAGQVGERRKVVLRRQPARFEAPHLAGRCGGTQSRFPTDNPARRIVAQALGVVHVLVSSEAAEDGLPEQPGQGMPAIPAGAFLGENLARMSVSPSASSSSRWTSSPASEVTTEPRNCSITRRSKPTLRGPSFDCRVRHDRILNARISY
jgi:hypothetical protein